MWRALITNFDANGSLLTKPLPSRETATIRAYDLIRDALALQPDEDFPDGGWCQMRCGWETLLDWGDSITTTDQRSGCPGLKQVIFVFPCVDER